MNSAYASRLLLLVILLTGMAALSAADELQVTIDHEGWMLVGDLVLPDSEAPRAFTLLLHKAAGNRQAYDEMATVLARRGIASLRIDLRGHGESINRGVFDPELSRYFDEDDPAIVRNFELIRAADRDIVAIMRWLDEQPELVALPFVVVGSSYTGQEMVEAARETRFADIYVALAPGSFNAESIAAIDPSGVPWLFVRAEIELPFFPTLFEAIDAGSETAEIWTLPGEGHATDLFDHNPDLHLRIVDWIEMRLL